MAVARPPAGASAGLKTLAVTSIIVAVVSLAGFVTFYTWLDGIQQEAAGAKKSAASAKQQASQARRDFDALTRKVSGDVTASDTAAVLEQLRTQLATMLADERLAGMQVDDQTPVLEVMQALHDQFTQTADELATTTTELASLSERVDDKTAEAQGKVDEYDAKTRELVDLVGELQTQFADARQAWQEQLSELSDQLADAANTANLELNKEREKAQAFEGQLTDAQGRIQDLLDQLASFKPSLDQHAVLREADGTIIQTVPAEDLVYISLGREDGVKAGMTFAVYSRVHGIPDSGQGKANLEVVNTFGNVSECHVTAKVFGQPIMQGDLIANPVFDRSIRYTFAVAGEFDLDFNDEIDDPDGSEVARMIRAMGGRVVDTLSTQTDFVVLGDRPQVPTIEGIKPVGDEDEGVLAERVKERTAARDLFDRVMTESRSLGIPVLSRTQFMHFVGKALLEKPE